MTVALRSRRPASQACLALLPVEWLPACLSTFLGAHHVVRLCDTVLGFDGHAEFLIRLLELLLGGGHGVGVGALVAGAGFGTQRGDACLVLDLDVDRGT